MTALETLNLYRERLQKASLSDRSVKKYLQTIENGELVSLLFITFLVHVPIQFLEILKFVNRKV